MTLISKILSGSMVLILLVFGAVIWSKNSEITELESKNTELSRSLDAKLGEAESFKAALALQTAKSESQKIEIENAKKELEKSYKKIDEKYRLTKPAATCEEQLEQIGLAVRSFYGGD